MVIRELQKTLYKSILLLIYTLSAIETMGFALVSYMYKFPPDIFFTFLPTQIVFHVVLCAALFFLSPGFYILDSGKKLETVNLANRLTIFRISMLPTLLFLIIAQKNHDIGPLLFICIGMTFITDLLDGCISRKTNQVTLIGKVLGSSSDYALIFVMTLAYYMHGLLPIWLFGLILFRIFFQAVGMAIILIIRKKIEPNTTILGKIAVATIMVLFALIPLDIFFPFPYRWIMNYLHVISGVIITISIIDKGWHFLRSRVGKKVERGIIENQPPPSRLGKSVDR
jgi:phosphatidylglycerophosphate synthase